jgi:hypothetical protein
VTLGLSYTLPQRGQVLAVPPARITAYHRMCHKIVMDLTMTCHIIFITATPIEITNVIVEMVR